MLPAVPDSQVCQQYRPEILPVVEVRLSDYGIRKLKTGLAFSRELTKDEYKEVGIHLREELKATLWQIGDWIMYGEALFSVTNEEREQDKRNRKRLGRGIAVELANIIGVSPQYVTDIKSVCQRVPIKWRSPLVTINHAREILQSGIPDAQFPYWAHRVITEHLPTRVLRIELRKSLRTELPSPTTKRPVLFAQKHSEFVREFMAQCENWTEAEVQAYAASHEPVLKFFRSRGL